MTLCPDKLIAHRGDQSRFPENTLESIQAALQAGALFVETDVQLSKNATPWLFHDRDMARLTGEPGAIHQLTDEEIRKRCICKDYAIPGLGEVRELLKDFPEVTLFVEAKRIALDQFGNQLMFDRIGETVGSGRDRCPLISFSWPFVTYALRHGWPQTGGVFDEKSPPSPLLDKGGSQIPAPLEKEEPGSDLPQYMFLHIPLLKRNPQWRFPDMKLAAYETSDPKLAAELLKNGVDLVETDQFSKLIEHD